MTNCWVLTEEVNDYNQYGEYLHSVFKVKPTIEEVKDVCGVDDSLANHILNGGGRVNYEKSWYHLNEVEFGTKYQSI